MAKGLNKIKEWIIEEGILDRDEVEEIEEFLEELI